MLTFPWNGATGTRAAVPALLRRDVAQPPALSVQRGQHRRQKPAAVQAAALAPGSADSCRPADQRGVLRQRADVQPRPHDAPGGSDLGRPAEAALGNSDSMHVTNTVPQMQPFNAGIWLDLESYALDHREDDMRISVFTGPFLLDDDPVRYGVRIPRSFWKVIAFIHDRDRQAVCDRVHDVAGGFSARRGIRLRPAQDLADAHRRHRAARGPVVRPPLRLGSVRSASEEGVMRPLTDPSQIEFG